MDRQGPSGINVPGPGDAARQVVSPGGWRVPSGRIPGWNWVPPAGAAARLDRVPRWVRIWFRTPYVDRYAHRWMWFHGGWDVDPPEELDPAAVAGLVWSTPAPRRHSTRAPAEWPTRLASFVIGLFDPAERYLQKSHPWPGRRGPHHRFLGLRLPRRRFAEYAAVGSGRRGSVREPSPEVLASMRQHAERMFARHEAALAAAEQRWCQQARVCAGELMRDGVTVLSLDGGQVRGRVVRFRRGDSVLELESVGRIPERGGCSRTRLSRRQETDADVLVRYLLQQVAQLDDRMNPDWPGQPE